MNNTNNISFTLESIDHITLTEQAYQMIRDAIINGEIHFGEKLTEVSVSKKLGISRSPIRNAFLKLANEGLIYIETNKCAHIWMPTKKDVSDIISLRCNLEKFASEIIISKIGNEFLEDMRENISEQEETLIRQDTLRLIHLDRKFHSLIVGKANNLRLFKYWEMLMGQWEALINIRYKVKPSLVDTVIQDHNKFFEAYKTKNINLVNEIHHETNDRITKELIEGLKYI